jgi:glucosylceramidase
VTVQNEPAAAQVWDSCLYSAEEERDFVRDHLGPTFKKAGLERVKIIIWDHNRDLLIERVQVAYNDPEASPYIWGAAFHWYGPEKYENLQLAHDAWPDKKLIFTEGCQEGGPHLGSWDVGERYGHEIINDLNRWTVGWIDWNMLLDETGGPNHVGNLCSAAVIADTVNDRLIFQSSYYYLGHFCRFIRPGAARILCASTREDLQVTAFRNPDESVAVVVLNRTDEERKFCLRLPDRAGNSAIPAHSISTYLWQPS